jgi:hypothetical protein
MVTAGTGAITFTSADGLRDYTWSVYSSDVIGAFTTFNKNGLAVAGSQNFFLIPEAGYISDMQLPTSNTVTTAWVPQVNDGNSGSVVPLAAILATLTTRSFPKLRISGGRKFTMLQA